LSSGSGIEEPLEFIEAPKDRVVVFIRQTGQGRESGVPLEIHFFQLYTIRNRKVRKVEIFRHRTEALEAAGPVGELLWVTSRSRAGPRSLPPRLPALSDLAAANASKQ
jgi:hypothetical protein